MTILSPDESAKRLELLKEVVPSASRVAFLWNRDNGSNAAQLEELEVAAPKLGMQLLAISARTPDELDSGFAAMTSHRADAYLMTGDPVHQGSIRRIVDLLIRNRLRPRGYSSELSSAETPSPGPVGSSLASRQAGRLPTRRGTPTECEPLMMRGAPQECAMYLVQEFRRHAEECRRMADLSRNKQGKDYWNELAERWLRCADNLEQEEQAPERPSRRSPRKDGRIAGRRQQAA